MKDTKDMEKGQRQGFFRSRSPFKPFMAFMVRGSLG